MDVTFWAHAMERVEVSKLRVERKGAWTVVTVDVNGSRLAMHVESAYPRTIERGRAFVAALSSALDAVEAASSPVPIESLAPDPVNEADKASTVLVIEESYLERVRRWGGTEAPEDEPRPAA